MTKEQIINFLTQKKTAKNLINATWTDLTTALGTLTATEKDAIAKEIAAGGGVQAIQQIYTNMVSNATAAALAEATAAISDDTLTLTELDSLL